MVLNNVDSRSLGFFHCFQIGFDRTGDQPQVRIVVYLKLRESIDKIW